MNLLISVIIPCYNQGEFIEESLQSVLNQTYFNWECLIINDGSTDNTEEIALQWVKKDSRFLYFLKNNEGVSSARNYGIEIAKGTFIQFLDSDDFLIKTKLEQSIEQVINNSEIDIVFTNFAMFSNSVSVLKSQYCVLKQECFTKEYILNNWNDYFSIPIHCGLIKKNVLENILFPTELTAQEDWFFWVKVFQKNIKIAFIDSPLALYRINFKSRTLSKSILNDYILVYQMFKEILSDDEFYKLSLLLISRYYVATTNLKNGIKGIKDSNTFRGGKLVKKILKKTGMLSIFRYLLLKIEKWNINFKN